MADPRITCPACQHSLTAVTVGALTVDVCQGGCGGIWFDNFELRQVDEAHEELGAALISLEVDPHRSVNPDARRICPKCPGRVVMMRRQFSREKAVIVDECPNCGGIWLDAGELAEIRRRTPTAVDRKREAGEYLNRRFLEDLAEIKARRANRSDL